jgi:hypothetical protein
MALALLPLARRLPNAVVPDDGYFYAQIAYSLATKGRSTFDGIHTTSGYHLPWAFLLAAISRLLAAVTLDKTIHLFAYLAVSLSLALATSLHFFKSRSFQLCAFVLIVANFSLTEMVLATPIMLGILRGVSAADDRGVRAPETWLALALPLVRIDLACVPLVSALLLFPRERRRALWLAGATLLGAATQLALMKVSFGHFVSVAAWLKTNGSLSNVPTTIAFNVGASAFQACFYAAHVVLAGVAITLRRDRTTWVIVLSSLSFVAMHTALNIMRGWYWLPSSLGVLFALAHGTSASVESGARRLLHTARAAVALLTFAFVVHAIRVEIVYAADQRGAAGFLDQLRVLVPKGRTLYTYDNPGFLGFFSGFDVVDGDGLVNDYDYAQRLMDGRLAGYLDEERICYVVIDGAGSVPVMDSGGLRLRADDVVELHVVRRHDPSQADFVLLRLTAPRCRE